jgi:hypothetical protein
MRYGARMRDAIDAIADSADSAGLTRAADPGAGGRRQLSADTQARLAVSRQLSQVLGGFAVGPLFPIVKAFFEASSAMLLPGNYPMSQLADLLGFWEMANGISQISRRRHYLLLKSSRRSTIFLRLKLTDQSSLTEVPLSEFKNEPYQRIVFRLSIGGRTGFSLVFHAGASVLPGEDGRRTDTDRIQISEQWRRKSRG